MTPAEIEVLLHCYCSPEPHPRLEAIGVQESLRKFLKHGIIQPTGTICVYETTAAGWDLVQRLRAVPMVMNEDNPTTVEDDLAKLQQEFERQKETADKELLQFISTRKQFLDRCTTLEANLATLRSMIAQLKGEA